MTTPAPDRDALLTGYLLGELSAAERVDFERRLGEDADLRAELERLRPLVGDLARLPDEAWNPPEPPPLALPVTEIPAPAPQRPVRPWFRRAPVAIAAACTAVAAVVVIALVTGGDEGADPGAASIALRPVGSGDPSAEGRLTTSTGGGEAELSVAGLAPSESGFYEVWLLGERGLVSLGSFTVGDGGDAVVELPVPVDPAGYESFDVSLEPDDGNPEHSGDSVLRGPTVAQRS